MSARQFIIVTAGLLWLASAHADCKPCGPTYCTETSEYAKALGEKKVALLKEHPARLVAILDKVGHCEACVRTAPDAFSLLRKDAKGTTSIDSWTAENEKIGARDVGSGKLNACRVIYARKACACCKEKEAETRSDWNKDLELNTGMSVPCSDQ